jgi:Pyridine nucleotide-disulphide oxidoreductase
MSAETYDFAIIGASSVGLIAADFAVKLGGRVALLERERIGGDCTWSGCVPSKSLLKVAKVAHDLRTAAYCVPAAAFKMLPDQTNPLVMLPVAPVAPCAPIAPCGPVAPVAPCEPVAPARAIRFHTPGLVDGSILLLLASAL